MDIPSWPQAGEREAELLQAVLQAPQWGGFHPFVAQFENRFAAYQHAAFGIGAFNGTVTLELALSILGIGAGDEVIVPAISFVSTATAVSRAGALPVFVDLEPLSFNIDPEQVERAITPRTRAIIPVHFGGAMADMDALLALAKHHNLLVIEDAAHAHGAEWRNRRAGSFGICGSFSFQNGKVLTSGEGGILTTNDPEFETDARAFTNQGRKLGESFYKHYTLGTNFRLTGLQAAVLLAQMDSLDSQIRRRSANAALLQDLLRDAPYVRWQAPHPAVTRNPFYLLPARLMDAPVGTRDRVAQKLNDAGVPCTPFYPFPLYRNPYYLAEGHAVYFPAQTRKDAWTMPYGYRIASCWRESAVMEQIAALILHALKD